MEEVAIIECPVCGSTSCGVISEELILGKFNEELIDCSSCGFMFFKTPHWLNESYNSSISKFDTGLVRRVKMHSARLFGISRVLKKRNHLDFGGGSGLMARMLRDYGLNSVVFDKYAENLYARGFSIRRADIISLIEVIEHLESPYLDLLTLKEEFEPDLFYITTETFTDYDPNWWYLQRDSGQHIGFFKIGTLQCLANKMDMYFYNMGGYYLFSKKKIGLLRLLIIYLFTRSITTPIIEGVKFFFEAKNIRKDYNYLNK